MTIRDFTEEINGKWPYVNEEKFGIETWKTLNNYLQLNWEGSKIKVFDHLIRKMLGNKLLISR